MYRTLLTAGLFIGGGVTAAELTCFVCTAISSFTEYNEKIRKYRTVAQQLDEISCQDQPRYRPIFWKNLKEVHEQILDRSFFRRPYSKRRKP